jgi:hypothetical protein
LTVLPTLGADFEPEMGSFSWSPSPQVYQSNQTRGSRRQTPGLLSIASIGDPEPIHEEFTVGVWGRSALSATCVHSQHNLEEVYDLFTTAGRSSQPLPRHSNPKRHLSFDDSCSTFWSDVWSSTILKLTIRIVQYSRNLSRNSKQF